MIRLTMAVLIASAVTSGALARDRCDTPIAEWLPRNVLKAKLEGDGWKVRSIKTEDGCYEALAINAKGEKVIAFFNPKNLEAVDTRIEH